MAKEDVFRIALDCFNMDYDKIYESNQNAVEIKYCNDFLESAVGFCGMAQPWYFLIESIEYTENDLVEGESFKGLNYGYELPDDMLVPLYANGEYDSTYAIKSDMIFFPYNKTNTLDYITKTINWKKFPYPTNYKYLIAYRLAMEISPYIAPDANKMSQISSQFQLQYQALISANNESHRRRNPRTDWFVI